MLPSRFRMLAHDLWLTAYAGVWRRVYADPADETGKLFAVDVEPVKKLKAPVTLAAIKADKRFASFVLTKVPRLSVMPVSTDEWNAIIEMSNRVS